MAAYNSDMHNLFEAAETKDDAGAELVVRVMNLSEGAVDAYDAYGNEVEIGLRPGGRYARIRATAAKSAEQAARIAGALTLFGHAGATTISDETLKRGITLARLRRRFACSRPRSIPRLRSGRNCSTGSWRCRWSPARAGGQ